MSSIYDQKIDLRDEIEVCARAFLEIIHERAHKYMTMVLVNAVARRMTLAELGKWLDNLKAATELREGILEGRLYASDDSEVGGCMSA